MTTSTQKHNLQELIVALQGIDSKLSSELQLLLQAGLHHSHLPESLQPSAAEMFQLAAEGVGGLPRMLLWADKNYGAFMKLYARQTNATISPVVPKQIEASTSQEWPDWLTQRRLAYQEAEDSSASSSDQQETSDGD